MNLVRAHGEAGASQAGFTECVNNAVQGKVAMWYDATSAAGSLEATGSPVKAKWTYVAAPVVKTKSSGWRADQRRRAPGRRRQIRAGTGATKSRAQPRHSSHHRSPGSTREVPTTVSTTTLTHPDLR